jgi:hypothetical protein
VLAEITVSRLCIIATSLLLPGRPAFAADEIRVGAGYAEGASNAVQI